MKNNTNIVVIGLGYVGLPLAVKFGEKYNTLGYDINKTRISELKNNIDSTKELTKSEIEGSHLIKFTDNEKDISVGDIYIITVPTPITKFREPNIVPLLNASKLVGSKIKQGDIVVYESTVYPGCTEDDCVPVLEQISGLKYGTDFACGYSPERIVPGDKERTLTKIKKIVSATNKKTLLTLENLYGSIIEAGVYLAPSIKVAEAAKVIENSQRDINIAFINELAQIFDKMDISTNEVLEAASTKWNFLSFKPGLVGGHCIGVDPYYLAHKAASFGHHPNLILSGRKINDSMSEFIVKKIIKKMIEKDIIIEKSKILILGITFKENCPDIRNTKVIDLIKLFKQFNCNLDIYDPVASYNEVKSEFDISLISKDDIAETYDSILRLVPHHEFNSFDYKKYGSNTIIFDLKGDWREESILSL